MFGIKYETWENICNMYFNLPYGSQQAYLQWFPFTKLTRNDKEYIKSKDFFEKYINFPSFILFKQGIYQSENFIQKGDGSFRDSSLVSPLLYLVLQSIGKEIHNEYKKVRPSGVSVYYAGTYDKMDPQYKKEYDTFFKDINFCIDKCKYQYFIKTDITSFFSNINIDKLILAIDENCNADKVVFSQLQLQIFKQLLTYCGNGRFPLIENSLASSYLATFVYLDIIDSRLYKYIVNKINVFSDFQMIRYVDDMYILFSLKKPGNYSHVVYNEIRNEYSSILKEYGLALNSKKCCIKDSKEINEELKKSLYDELYKGNAHNIGELFKGKLKKFLIDLSKILAHYSIDVETYNELINKHFFSSDIEYNSSDIFNYMIYENEKELKSVEVVEEIEKMVKQDISFISLDPKRLTTMIIKSESEKAIKTLLNQLFKRDRFDKWNLYDTTIAISYLIQSKFKHIDLLNIIYKRHFELYSFYINYCKNSFIEYFNLKEINKLREIIDKDNKVYYLYFMYLCEKKRSNYMAAFSYYKNYFDRVTAILAFIFDRQVNEKRPNYKKFYTNSSLKKFYLDISDSEIIISKAQDYRNKSPLSHASSELLDNDSTSKDLIECIESLSTLIDKYVCSKINF